MIWDVGGILQRWSDFVGGEGRALYKTLGEGIGLI